MKTQKKSTCTYRRIVKLAFKDRLRFADYCYSR